MKKVSVALDNTIKELNSYLEAFGWLLPSGEGAKAEAIKEWKDCINRTIINLKNLEKRQIEIIEKGNDYEL